MKLMKDEPEETIKEFVMLRSKIIDVLTEASANMEMTVILSLYMDQSFSNGFTLEQTLENIEEAYKVFKKIKDERLE